MSNSILEKIRAVKVDEIQQGKKLFTTKQLDEFPIADIRPFTNALLNAPHPAIIAEIKKASPSKGIIRSDFDVKSHAREYEQHGACCLSVLTDKPFFQGDDSFVKIAKEHSSIPVLRKEFIIDSWQIHQSRALGADCILLIVAMLDDVELYDFCMLAQELGMSVLVESHHQEELKRALKLPTPLMGINNRCLHTFKTSLQTSIDLKSIVSKDKIIISESGFNTRADIKLMQQHGIHHFLIGESLMRQRSPGLALLNLRSREPIF